MIRKQVLTLLVLSLLFSCRPGKTEVSLCATLHGAHKENPKYSYRDLYTFIGEYNPDVIGVEIRREDMDSSQVYLSRYYPREMWETVSKFSSRQVLGFDWLGQEIEGQGIPKGYFDQLEVKVLGRKLNQDTSMQNQFMLLDSLAELKHQLALQSSIVEINDGRYDELNRIYYRELSRLLNGTPYQGIADFYEQRDVEIAGNIIQIIRENRGKKLLFLMGADHRSYTVARIKAEFGDTIVLDRAFRE